MRRLVPVASAFLVFIGCQCGGSGDLCEGVKCHAPLFCEPSTGACTDPGGAGGGSTGSGGGSGGGMGGAGGGSAANCTATTGCAFPTPVCNEAANGGLGACVTCSATAGCSGSTPFCDFTANSGGTCVGCRNVGDCTTFGDVCDFPSHTCVQGGTGGGSGGGSGAGGGSGGSTVVVFDDAGTTAHCLPFDAGSAACTTECGRGYTCVSGQCVLRGSTGPVQVTLRFPQDEDLDLHVVEPVPPSSTCEIWYGNTNTTFDAGIVFPFPIPIPAACGAKGWLDLDSNPACNLDHVRVENVIYPANQAASVGNYTVRVDYYQNCTASSPVPYEVEVRANGQTRWYCGSFAPGASDTGSAGSGRTITTFTLK